MSKPREGVIFTHHFHRRLYERAYLVLADEDMEELGRQMAEELKREPAHPGEARVMFDCVVNGQGFCAVYCPVKNLLLTALPAKKRRMGRNKFMKKHVAKFHVFKDHREEYLERRRAAKFMDMRKGRRRPR